MLKVRQLPSDKIKILMDDVHVQISIRQFFLQFFSVIADRSRRVSRDMCPPTPPSLWLISWQPTFFPRVPSCLAWVSPPAHHLPTVRSAGASQASPQGLGTSRGLGGGAASYQGDGSTPFSPATAWASCGENLRCYFFHKYDSRSS